MNIVVRKALIGGRAFITVVLRKDQKKALSELAIKASQEKGRFVSASELIRDAVDMYITARNFFTRKNEDAHDGDMPDRQAS